MFEFFRNIESFFPGKYQEICEEFRERDGKNIAFSREFIGWENPAIKPKRYALIK